MYDYFVFFAVAAFLVAFGFAAVEPPQLFFLHAI